jgi:hypothetical protein
VRKLRCIDLRALRGQKAAAHATPAAWALLGLAAPEAGARSVQPIRSVVSIFRVVLASNKLLVSLEIDIRFECT